MLEIDNDFVSVSLLPGTRIVRVLRKSRRFENTEDMYEAWGRVGEVFDLMSRADYRLLLDLRPVAGRNDPAYEDSMSVYRRRTLEGFARAAILVETVSGRLQVERYAREDRTHAVRAFLSEKKAMEWLQY